MTSSKAKLGSFEELMEASAPEMRAVARAARALILSEHAGATEVVRLGDRAASYGFGPKKMSEAHTYVIPNAGHVNLGFFYGARLPDPSGLLEGTGKAMRHVKLRSVADVEACRALVQAAVRERAEALGGR